MTRTLDKTKIETRYFETRRGSSSGEAMRGATVTGTGRSVSGIACPSNSEAKIGFGEAAFYEKFLPGAWKKTISERGPQVIALYNHNPDYVLAKGSAGLALSEISAGLSYRFEMPDISYGNDVLKLLELGLVSGASVGFQVIKETWDSTWKHRTIQEARLIEFSLTATPAYTGTSAQARGDDWSELCALADNAAADYALREAGR